MSELTASAMSLHAVRRFLRESTSTENPNAMPYVNVKITAGATREQKTAIVRDITDSLVRVLDKKPEHIHVVIDSVAEDDWGYAGQLTDDWKKSQPE